MIPKQHSELTILVKRYLGYIVPARLIVDTSINEVSYRQEHQLTYGDLFIGAGARALRILLHVSDKDISVSCSLCNNHTKMLNLSTFIVLG